jgi:hypothetical protein
MILNPVLAKISAIWRRFAYVPIKKDLVKEKTLEQPILEVQEQTPILTGHQTRQEMPTLPDIQKSPGNPGQTQPHPALSAGFSSGRHARSRKQKKGSRKNLKSK